jgi:hypothetical protein
MRGKGQYGPSMSDAAASVLVSINNLGQVGI